MKFRDPLKPDGLTTETKPWTRDEVALCAGLHKMLPDSERQGLSSFESQGARFNFCTYWMQGGKTALTRLLAGVFNSAFGFLLSFLALR